MPKGKFLLAGIPLFACGGSMFFYIFTDRLDPGSLLFPFVVIGVVLMAAGFAMLVTYLDGLPMEEEIADRADCFVVDRDSEVVLRLEQHGKGTFTIHVRRNKGGQ